MSEAADGLKPEEIAGLMFNLLALAVDRKNAALERVPVAKPIKTEKRTRPRKAELLYIAKQEDIAGQFKIDIDWPTEQLAIKNHYLLRIVFSLDDNSISLTLGSSSEPMLFPITEHRSVLQVAEKAVLLYR